jgi:hypothetical protein
MAKVVYNACYGGFGLSYKAIEKMVELGYEFKPNPNYDPTSDDWYNRKYKYLDSCYDIPRHDPILVKVVEELGEFANGPYADLQIAEVDGLYRIDEYDGSESVETPDSYDWQYAG